MNEDRTNEPLRLAAEAQSIRNAGPDLYTLARETGNKVVEVNGELRVYFRSKGRTQHDNDVSARKAMAMLEGRTARAKEVSEAREARRGGDVAVRGPDGRIRHAPGKREAGVARKSTFTPVIQWGTRLRYRKTESEYRAEIEAERA